MGNIELERIQRVCRELRDHIDEECHTFSYDDMCGLGGTTTDQHEMHLLSRAVERHPRLKYFECLIRRSQKLRALLAELQLPRGTKCSFVFEFKVGAAEVHQLLNRFRVWRLSIIPEES